MNESDIRRVFLNTDVNLLNGAEKRFRNNYLSLQPESVTDFVSLQNQ